jgi:hypothetical protein
MTIETLAEKYRLKITRDECNDKIIAGSRGQLYCDAGSVCAMWLNAPISLEKLRQLGGKLWAGDGESDGRRYPRRVRDAKITGIPVENIPRAIRLTGTRIKREISEEERERLKKMRAVLAKKKGGQPT